ncbi:MAG: hypothetical protein AB8F74_00720, partial [Saprospiraceae bacterium]
MRKYIVIKIVALLLIAQTGFSQTGAAAQMTPAEYQEFISMLVKAKKKRMAKKRAAYYQQYYASQPPAPLQQQQPVAQAPPQIIEKPAPVNTETAEKIKALEEVQNRLMVQVQQDESNKSAYDSIEIQLQNQLVDLRQQLSEEQFQARQNELEWQRKLQEQQLAESRRSIETVTAPVIVDNGERKSDDQLYAERHRAIQR